MITPKSTYAPIVFALLTGVFAVAEELQKIEPLEGAEPSFVAQHFSLELMVKEFGQPDSKLGAFVAVPTGDYLPDREVRKVVHFSQSDEHSVSVPYKDATTAIVVADGRNLGEGFCTAVFLVAITPRPDSEFACRIDDCVRHSRFGGYSSMAPRLVKLPQFSKPLLHISYYNGGRLTGEFFDEWFRMDRGKLEPVLALVTGQYRHDPPPPGRVGISQETTFRTKGGKLIAKSERTTEFPDKPGKGKHETFETVFTWNSTSGKFTSKSTKKLEMLDRPDAQ